MTSIKFGRREFLLGLGSTTLASLAFEGFLTCKVSSNPKQNPFSHNEIIAAQLSGGVFFPDPEIGHRLTPRWAYVLGRDYDYEKDFNARKKVDVLSSSFVGRDDLETLDQVVNRIRSSDKPIVLNIGDSSTSGWKSDAITRNNKKLENFLRKHYRISKNNLVELLKLTLPELRDKLKINKAGFDNLRLQLESPFFHYPTYSDLLAEKGFCVVNGGTPGYSSLQLVRYLKRVLGELKGKGITPDFVTIYVGNNDSVWCGNTQDKYVLPGFSCKTLGLFKTLQTSSIYLRVDVDDYKDNLTEMVQICRQHSTTPILIHPVIPKYWEPGLRARGEQKRKFEVTNKYHGQEAYDHLIQAEIAYSHALHYMNTDIEKAKKLFIEAQELDFITPRIKSGHISALRKVAKEMNISFVNVQSQIPVDDRKHFGDYCHPEKLANKLIVGGIIAVIQ